MLHVFFIFFYVSFYQLVEAKKNTKGATKSTRSKIALSGCQSSLQLKKKPKKGRETAFTESKDAAVPVWDAEIGRMVPNSYERFSGHFVHLEKKVSPKFVHIVSLSCQAQP